MRTAALLVAMVLVPVGAIAQEEVARSFEQLNRVQLLDEGDTVWILSDLGGAGEYEEMKGKFVSLSETTLGFRVDSVPAGAVGLDVTSVEGRYVIALPQDRVRRIDVGYTDSPENGLAFGALAGFCALGIPALISVHSCDGGFGCGENVAALAVGAVGAAIGAGIGLAIDLAITGRRAVYAAPDAPGVLGFSVTPLVTRQRKGLLFTIRW